MLVYRPRCYKRKTRYKAGRS